MIRRILEKIDQFGELVMSEPPSGKHLKDWTIQQVLDYLDHSIMSSAADFLSGLPSGFTLEKVRDLIPLDMQLELEEAFEAWQQRKGHV